MLQMRFLWLNARKIPKIEVKMAVAVVFIDYKAILFIAKSTSQ
jgi:hypothetical protein